MRAMRLRQTYRTDECSFDEILSLTDTPDRADVIDHYVQEKQLASIDRKMFLIASAATLAVVCDAIFSRLSNRHGFA